MLLKGMLMSEKERTYIAIDLKSFYASVECIERDLDPLTTNLVVADESRTDKTICLAVSPSLKSHGIPGRCRLFELKQKVKEANGYRRMKYGSDLKGEGSCDANYLAKHPEVPIDYIIAPPRLGYYMEYSSRIYDIYLKYVAPEDIHIYSIDEVFMDVTGYLDLYGMDAHKLTMTIIRDVLKETGITATAGIGTNMYLAKIAMDIEAKHIEADEDGVRIAELDEMSYRRSLWNHRPITDFWRVGRGYAKKLASHGIYTMGDVARCSIGGPNDFYNEDLLYKIFGVNAELLIDHAWGWEPCTIADIKDYRPSTNSLSSGQVLQKPYAYHKAELIVKEMVDKLALDMLRKHLVCDQVTLTIGYDIENVMDEGRRSQIKGEVVRDYYGREVPKHAHGTESLGRFTASASIMMDAFLRIFKRTVDPNLLVRRITVVAENIKLEKAVAVEEQEQQISFFDFAAGEKDGQGETSGQTVGISKEILGEAAGPSEEELEEEMRIQQTLLAIKEKFGSNAVVKAMDLEEDATGMERNRQIGGHKA